MGNFAKGGVVTGGKDFVPLMDHGCDYVIPFPLARRLYKIQATLDRLNESDPDPEAA